MESRASSEAAAAAWIARREEGAWTEADQQSFEAWLAESTGNRVAYFRLNAAWHETGRLKSLLAGAAPAPATKEERSGSSYMRWRALAAMLLLAIGASAFVIQLTRERANTHATSVGGLETVPMADGSRVILNTNSRLSIELTSSERRIELDSGEAFFQVAKDPNRPFVVSVGDQRIIAVGTAFSVRRERDGLRLVVSEGIVRMENARAQQPSPEPLSAGSVARVRNEDVLVQKQTLAEVERSLAWRSGLLTFRDTPLSVAVSEFNRYNVRQIEIEDAAVAELEIGGIFRATEPDAFVRLLEEGFPVHASQEGERIVLRAD